MGWIIPDELQCRRVMQEDPPGRNQPTPASMLQPATLLPAFAMTISRPRDPDQALDLDRGNSKILDFLDSSFGNTRPVRTVSKIWSNTTPG